MYVVFDSVTETLIGPFEAYEDAQMFLLHASDLLVDGNVTDLTIEPVSEPQEWAMDNSLDTSVFA
jgi:hypothetical protein